MVVEANAEAQTFPKHIFSGGNQSALRIVIELKILNLLASNYVLYFISIALLANRVHVVLALALYPSVRIFTLFVPMIFADLKGRRHLFLISVILTGASLFTMGIMGVIGVFDIVVMSPMLLMIGITGCLVQAFVQLGLEPVQHIYSVEAFPLAKRTTSLIFVNCIEHLVHIFLIITFVTLTFVQFTYLISIFIYSVAIFIGGICLHKRLPETRGMTLRQCHNAFNRTRLPITSNTKTGISSIGIAYTT